MRVQVHYFAVLREYRGTSVEELKIDEGMTMVELFAKIFGESPWADLPVLFTMDQAYVSGDAQIRDCAEVSFLPPLGGG